ncbi:hypothetical protein B0H19DRAFT_1264163 [Mycena capillaripes]|nr:hypothetical protein B0H19DRAFT_1264163 [Mycena capillaripes]
MTVITVYGYGSTVTIILPPPPPADESLHLVHINSLEAALDKLNIQIPAKDLIKAIRDKDEARRTVDETQRGAVLSLLALQPTKLKAGLNITTLSRFVPKSNDPVDADPLVQERRRRLVELAKEAFPDGKKREWQNPPFNFECSCTTCSLNGAALEAAVLYEEMKKHDPRMHDQRLLYDGVQAIRLLWREGCSADTNNAARAATFSAMHSDWEPAKY